MSRRPDLKAYLRSEIDRAGLSQPDERVFNLMAHAAFGWCCSCIADWWDDRRSAEKTGRSRA